MPLTQVARQANASYVNLLEYLRAEEGKRPPKEMGVALARRLCTVEHESGAKMTMSALLKLDEPEQRQAA